MDRFKRTYAAIAIVALNTLLLAAVVLGLVHLFLPPLDRGPTYSGQFKLDAYSRISREDAIAVGREFDDMGEQRSFEFDPWTLFRERAYEGKHLNVSDAGVRASIAPDPRFADREPLRVWALGGSTMFGWGMPDSQTVASHLQAILQDSYQERQVQVTNFGHGYFTSSSELAYFVSLLRTEPLPEIAVFLDGLNDALIVLEGIDVPYFSGNLYDAWEAEREKQTGVVGNLPWVTLNNSFPLFRLTERLGGRDETGSYEGPERYRKSPDDPVAFAVHQFDTNRRLIHAAGKELGIETYQFLQPVKPGMYNPRLHRQDSGGLAGMYGTLLSRPRTGLYSLVGTLQGVPTGYVDGIHYSDEGCYRVARAIGETIAGQRERGKRGLFSAEIDQ